MSVELVKIEADDTQIGQALAVAGDVDLARRAQGFVIETEPDAIEATSLLGEIKLSLKAVAAQKELLVKPARQIIEHVRWLAEPLEKALTAGEVALKDQIRTWHQKCETEAEKRREEAARLAAAEKAKAEAEGRVALPAVERYEQPHEKLIVGAKAATTLRRDWKWDVTDEAAIPREYLTLDRGKVTAAVRGGTREIPGIRIYQVQSVQMA